MESNYNKILIADDWKMQDYIKKIKQRREKELKNSQQNIINTTTKDKDFLGDTNFLNDTKVKFI